MGSETSMPWVVERTFVWMTRWRRLVRDDETAHPGVYSRGEWRADGRGTFSRINSAPTPQRGTTSIVTKARTPKDAKHRKVPAAEAVLVWPTVRADLRIRL